MGSNFINSIIRRSNLNQFIFALVVLIGVIGALVLSANYYYNLFNGPFDMSKSDLLKIDNLDDVKQYFVNLKGDDVIDTGYYYSTTNYGVETGQDHYAAVLFNKQFLLVQVPGDVSDTVKNYTGALKPIPSDVQSDIMDSIYHDEPSVKGHFLPFMLDTSDFRGSGYVGLVVAIIVGLICVWIIIRSLRRMGNPASHPIMRGLARFGDAEQTTEQIEFEMNQDHPKVGKNLHLTRNWLVYRTASTLSATKLSDVVWVYKHVTQRRTYGVATGKTFKAMIYDRYGSNIVVPGKEADVAATLESVARQSPWAQVGYTKDWEQKWKQQRAAFIAAVDQRKKEMQQR
ncbi:MAG: DUF6709 family protein [Chloroflexota bacterium]